MIQTECYYNQLKTNAIFETNKIKIGTKTISHDKIYHIREEYITQYSAIIKPAIIVTSAIVAALFSILVLQTVSLLIIVIAAFLGSVYVYYIYPKQLRENNPDSYIKIVDIIYRDTHESIVVKAGVDLKIKEIRVPKKGMWQKRILGRYLTRINKSRKYLIMQHEMNPEFTVVQLNEKYSTVAQTRYGLNSTLGLKAIEALCEGYDLTAGKSVKLGYRLSRFCLMMIVILIIYLVLNNSIGYQGFF